VQSKYKDNYYEIIKSRTKWTVCFLFPFYYQNNLPWMYTYFVHELWQDYEKYCQLLHRKYSITLWRLYH